MKRITTFFLLPLLLAISCTSDFSGIEILEFDKLTITANKTAVNGLEIIEINIQNLENPEAQYAATFGTEAVTLVQTDSTAYVTVVPDLPTGSYDFVADVAPEQSLEFQVTETTLISSPEQTVIGIIAYPTSIIDELEASTDSLIAQGLVPPVAKNRLQEITNDFNQAISDFQNAPQDEKEFTAKFLKANSQLFQTLQDAILELEESIPLVGALSPRGGACMGKKYDAETQDCLSKELDRLTIKFVLKAVGIVVAGVAVNYIPGGSTLSKPILIGGSILLLTKYHNNLLDIIKNTFLLFEKLVFSDANAGEPILLNESYPVDVMIPKRNVQREDVSSQYNWVGAMITTFDKFKSTWDKVRKVPIIGKELFEIDFPKRIVENKPTETLDFLSIEILGDVEGISGEFSGTPEELSISFNRAEDSDIERFQYKIIYNDGYFQAESEVMTATVKVGVTDPPNLMNTFVYNNKSYFIKDGIILDAGVSLNHSVYGFTIVDVELDIDTLENGEVDVESSGSKFLFTAAMWSPDTVTFRPGRFEFTDVNTLDEDDYGQYLFYPASVIIDSRGFEDENGQTRDDIEVQQDVVDGTITVSGSGLTYTLEVDVTLGNGQRLQGSCSLTFEYIDER